MFKRIISERFAITALASVLFIFIVVHLLIMLDILPFDMIWGGRLKNRTEMSRLESISIGFTALLLIIVGIRSRFIRIKIPNSVLRIFFGLFSLLFLVNTLGNATSVSHLEQWVFTPLTLILAICSMRLAIYKSI